MIRSIRKNLAIFRTLAKINFANVAVYRASFYTRIIVVASQLGFDILFFVLIFRVTNTIQGWGYWESILLVGLAGVIYDLIFVFFIRSLLEFVKSVQTGQFDLILVKPVNTRFYISCQRYNIANFTLIRFGIIVWALANTAYQVTLRDIAWSLLLLLGGMFIAYCMYYIVSSVALITITNTGIDKIFWQILFFMRYPPSVYSPVMGFVFTFVAPMILMAAVPATALLGKLRVEYILYTGAVVVLFYSMSELFWKYALRKYSSASS